MKITLYHNILWSFYKAIVFTQFSKVSKNNQSDLKIFQIASTENSRKYLTSVNKNIHQYNYEVLFEGAYEDIPKLSLFWRLTKLAWKDDAEIAILPGAYKLEYFLLLLIYKIRRKKTVVFSDSTLHDTSFSWGRTWLKRCFFYFCDAYLTYGERGREYLLYFGAHADRIFIRYQAAYLPMGLSHAEVVRARVASAPGYFNLLYVGRLSEEKDIPTLLAAFGRVAGFCPQARLSIIGNGILRQQVKEWVESLGLSARVDLLGGLSPDEIAGYYLAADALVLPSVREPWGLVVNEALSYGCPVIASDHCGCVPELIVDGTSGYVFPAGDVEALVARMRDVHDHFAERAKIAAQCLEIIARFSPEVSAQQMFDCCRITVGRV